MPSQADGDGSGFLDVVVHKSVQVDGLGPLEGTILWADFPTTAEVGADTSALGDPVFEDGDGNAINGVTLSVSINPGIALGMMPPISSLLMVPVNVYWK